MFNPVSRLIRSCLPIRRVDGAAADVLKPVQQHTPRQRASGASPSENHLKRKLESAATKFNTLLRRSKKSSPEKEHVCESSPEHQEPPISFDATEEPGSLGSLLSRGRGESAVNSSSPHSAPSSGPESGPRSSGSGIYDEVPDLPRPFSLPGAVEAMSPHTVFISGHSDAASPASIGSQRSDPDRDGSSYTGALPSPINTGSTGTGDSPRSPSGNVPSPTSSIGLPPRSTIMDVVTPPVDSHGSSISSSGLNPAINSTESTNSSGSDMSSGSDKTYKINEQTFDAPVELEMDERLAANPKPPTRGASGPLTTIPEEDSSDDESGKSDGPRSTGNQSAHGSPRIQPVSTDSMPAAQAIAQGRSVHLQALSLLDTGRPEIQPIGEDSPPTEQARGQVLPTPLQELSTKRQINAAFTHVDDCIAQINNALALISVKAIATSVSVTHATGLLPRAMDIERYKVDLNAYLTSLRNRLLEIEEQVLPKETNLPAQESLRAELADIMRSANETLSNAMKCHEDFVVPLNKAIVSAQATRPAHAGDQVNPVSSVPASASAPQPENSPIFRLINPHQTLGALSGNQVLPMQSGKIKPFDQSAFNRLSQARTAEEQSVAPAADASASDDQRERSIAPDEAAQLESLSALAVPGTGQEIDAGSVRGTAISTQFAFDPLDSPPASPVFPGQGPSQEARVPDNAMPGREPKLTPASPYSSDAGTSSASSSSTWSDSSSSSEPRRLEGSLLDAQLDLFEKMKTDLLPIKTTLLEFINGHPDLDQATVIALRRLQLEMHEMYKVRPDRTWGGLRNPEARLNAISAKVDRLMAPFFNERQNTKQSEQASQQRKQLHQIAEITLEKVNKEFENLREERAMNRANTPQTLMNRMRIFRKQKVTKKLENLPADRTMHRAITTQKLMELTRIFSKINTREQPDEAISGLDVSDRIQLRRTALTVSGDAIADLLDKTETGAADRPIDIRELDQVVDLWQLSNGLAPSVSSVPSMPPIPSKRQQFPGAKMRDQQDRKPMTQVRPISLHDAMKIVKADVPKSSPDDPESSDDLLKWQEAQKEDRERYQTTLATTSLTSPELKLKQQYQ